MTTIIFAILLSTICILLYFVFNLYSKLDALYKQIDLASDVEQRSVLLVQSLVVKYSQILNRLKRVDRRGSFESDDEVGFVFKTIKETIETLVEELRILENKLQEADGNDGTGND
jgi:hypothetical protein